MSIGLILVFLSLGYLWGGRLADRHPSERALGCVALVAAAGIAVLPFATQPIFRWSSDAFVHLSAGAFVGSFVAAMAMFALPVTALGAVAPWAVRLAVRDVGEAGTVAGRLYALSTLGSIAGTFLPVLVLVPAIGSRRTFLVVAALLALAAVPMLGPRSLGAPAVAVGLLLIPTGLVKPGAGVLFEGESPYQFVQVVKVGGVTELTSTRAGPSIPSTGRAPCSRAATGTRSWPCPCSARPPAGRLAVLGNAAGTVARAYGTAWPHTHVDGVELDPLVTQVGRRYFGEGRLPMLTVHTDDARRTWPTRARATTRSWSTPTASPTSPST